MTPAINGAKVDITVAELIELLKEAYRHGYATYETAEAGLERYDADAYARWVVFKHKFGNKNK